MKVNPKYALYIKHIYDNLAPLDDSFVKAMQSNAMDIINHKLGIAGIVVEQLKIQKPTMLKTVYNKCINLQKQYPKYTVYIFDICGTTINYQPFEYIKKHKDIYAKYYQYRCGKSLVSFAQEIQEQKRYIDNLIQCKKQNSYCLYLINLLKKLYLSKSPKIDYKLIKFRTGDLYYNNKQLGYDEFVEVIR